MFEIFLKFLKEKKNNIINSKNNDFAKILFFSGHDTIMGYCIRALLTKDEIIKLGKELSLNYASHFEIELRNCTII